MRGQRAGGARDLGAGLLRPPAPPLGDPSHSPTFNPCQRAPRLWGALRQPQIPLPLSHPKQPHVSSAGPKFHAHPPPGVLAGNEGSAQSLPRTRAHWWWSLSWGLIPPLRGWGGEGGPTVRCQQVLGGVSLLAPPAAVLSAGRWFLWLGGRGRRRRSPVPPGARSVPPPPLRPGGQTGRRGAGRCRVSG